MSNPGAMKKNDLSYHVEIFASFYLIFRGLIFTDTLKKPTVVHGIFYLFTEQVAVKIFYIRLNPFFLMLFPIFPLLHDIFSFYPPPPLHDHPFQSFFSLLPVFLFDLQWRDGKREQPVKLPLIISLISPVD